MAFDFPTSPTIGQVSGNYAWDGEKWVAGAAVITAATKKNYIINGAMQISQENGLTAVTANAAYPVDQWMLGFINGGTHATLDNSVLAATQGLNVKATSAAR